MTKPNAPPQTKFFEIFAPFTSDYGFSVTFGNDHDQTFAKRALAVLIGEPHPLKLVNFGKNVVYGRHKKARKGIYDLNCVDERGREFLMEMQMASHLKMHLRMKYYLMLKMQEYASKGKYLFDNLPKMYGICILGYKFFPDEDYYRRSCNYDEKFRLIDDQMEYIYIELPKFKKAAEECITDLEKLIYCIKMTHKIKDIDIMPNFMQEDWLESALRQLDTRGMSIQERIALEMEVGREVHVRTGQELMEKRIKELMEETKMYEQQIKEDRQQIKENRQKIKKAQLETQQEKQKAGAEKQKAEAEKQKAEAEKQINIQTIRNLITNLHWSNEQITSVMGVSTDWVAQIRAEIENPNPPT